MAGYWWDVVQRAFSETFEASGIGFWGPLTVVIGAAIYGWQNGWTAIPENLWDMAKTGGLSFAAVFVVIFAFKLVAVPPTLRAEEQAAAATTQQTQAAEIERLKSEMLREAEKQAALDELWALRKQGVELRNRQIAKDEFPQWSADYRTWEAAVLDKAAVLSVNLRQWIALLNETAPPPLGAQPVSPDHALEVRTMSEQLRRLEDYLTIGLK